MAQSTSSAPVEAKSSRTEDLLPPKDSSQNTQGSKTEGDGDKTASSADLMAFTEENVA